MVSASNQMIWKFLVKLGLHVDAIFRSRPNKKKRFYFFLRCRWTAEIILNSRIIYVLHTCLVAMESNFISNSWKKNIPWIQSWRWSHLICSGWFWRLVTSTTGGAALCPNITRFGGGGDGGYDVCVTPPFKPEPGNCLVYSFGLVKVFVFWLTWCHERSFVLLSSVNSFSH